MFNELGTILGAGDVIETKTDRNHILLGDV